MVGAPVGAAFELVGEEAAAWGGGGGGLGGCEVSREVDELVGVDDGGGGDEGYGCAEGEEEGGFFGGLVVGHAAVWGQRVRRGGGEGRGQYICARYPRARHRIARDTPVEPTVPSYTLSPL